MTSNAKAAAAAPSLKRFFASHFLPLCCLSTIPLLGLVYLLLNGEGRHAYSLVTDLDRQIPFLSIFVLPYLGWFAFILGSFVYLAVKDRSAYWKTLLRFNIGLLLCYAIYAVFQTHVPRPEIVGDGLLDRLVAAVYRFDEPYNCFPSTHVLTSYFMILAFRSSPAFGRGIRAAATVIALTIIASTLFVKQHVLMDAAGAIVLAELIWRVFEKAAARAHGRRAPQRLGHHA